jgi:hypothetical protein
VDVVRLVNLTPLHFVIEGANGGRSPLAPLGEVQAQRPPGSTFGVNCRDRVSGITGIRLAELQVNPGAAELKIEPHMLASRVLQRVRDPVSGQRGAAAPTGTILAASFLNRSNVDVEVFQMYASGLQDKKLMLVADAGLVPDSWRQGYVSGNQGDVFVARRAGTGEVLAMLVIESADDHLMITGEFRSQLAARAAGAVAMPDAGAVEVVNQTPMEFDLDDDAGGRWHLRPGEQVKVRRPWASKFAVKVNGMRVAARELEPQRARLEIRPDMFVPARPTAPGKHPVTGDTADLPMLVGSARLMNRSGESIKVCAADGYGREVEQCEIGYDSDSKNPSDQLVRGPIGNVYVVRRTATGDALAMFVLQDGDQQLTITGDFEVVNRTPLSLSIGWADQMRLDLQPFDLVKVVRPADSKLVVTSPDREHRLGEVPVGPLASGLKIVPELLASARPRQPVGDPSPARANLVNKAGVNVDVLWVGPQGMEIKTCTIEPEPAPQGRVVAGQNGELYVARAADTGDILSMFVLDGTRGWTISNSFREQVAPSVRRPAYDLLEIPQPLPDPKDGKYVRHCAQDLSATAQLNGWERPVRRVTISGLELVLDANDRYSVIRDYCNKEDIQQVYILADTVVVRTGLRFPQADVSIFARDLRFEGPSAFIDTQPLDSTYRDPSKIDGDDGVKGGDINLFVEVLTPDRTMSKHLRTTGARGQDPDEGGYVVTGTVKHLKPVTKEDWQDLFSYKNRKVHHQKMLGG